MKIERTVSVKTFEDVDIGEVFRAEDGEGIYLRIDVDEEYTVAHNHDGLAVNLDNGVVTWFDNHEKVILMPYAKVIC